jgi:ribosomal-protein-serine acetyltransferase
VEIYIDNDLLLRTLVEDDASTLFALVDGNRKYLREWLPWLDVNLEVNDSLSFIRHHKTSATRPEDQPLGILHQSNLCGVIGYDWVKDKSCSLGYWIAEEAQGKGIATRASGALIGHAFSEMNLDTVEIHVAEGNLQSRSVAERLGLTLSHRKENAEQLYGRYIDHIVYVKSKDDPS